MTRALLFVALPPRVLAFYGTDPAWFRELGVELGRGGVYGTRENLALLAQCYADDADPVESGIDARMRRNAREGARLIREALR